MLSAQALLKHSDACFDFPRLVHCLVQALSDHSRVITAAIEALAVVHHLIGDQIQGLLVTSGASVSSRLMLAARFASHELPKLDTDGGKEHEVSALSGLSAVIPRSISGKVIFNKVVMAHCMFVMMLILLTGCTRKLHFCLTLVMTARLGWVFRNRSQ